MLGYEGIQSSHDQGQAYLYHTDGAFQVYKGVPPEPGSQILCSCMHLRPESPRPHVGQHAVRRMQRDMDLMECIDTHSVAWARLRHAQVRQ